MTLAEILEPIGQIRSSTPGDTRLTRILNNSMRWGCSYTPPTSFGTSEYAVRGTASVAMLLAVGVQTQAYDAALSGLSTYLVPNTRSISLLNATTAAHRSVISGGWGGQWQSAWWATLLGTTGWIQWRYLQPADRERLLGVLESEADARLAQPPLYMRGPDGLVAQEFTGDTKAEENAWNSCGLACAALMMPGHARAGEWMTAAVRLAVSSFAHPSDVDSDRIVSGRPLREWLEGSNVEETYDVVNHGRINPDYSQAVCLPGHAAILFGLAGRPIPEAWAWNCDRVYARLTGYYKPGEPAQPVAYPDGTDWGVRRSLSCWWPDITALTLGWDTLSERSAGYWADVHLADVDAMQARATTGQIYAGTSEDSYPAREQIGCYQLAAGHLLMWLHRHGRVRTTAAAY